MMTTSPKSCTGRFHLTVVVPLLLLSTSCTVVVTAQQQEDAASFRATCVNWKEPCPTGVAMARCKEDPCAVSGACDDGAASCHANYCGGCHAVCCTANKDKDGLPANNEARPCFKDLRWCSDGVSVVRDPYNDCLFPLCENDGSVDVEEPGKEEEVATFMPCTKDLNYCETQGTTVSRDPYNNCKFFPCEDGTAVDLTDTVEEDNTDNTDNGGSFGFCAMDMKECDDGSYVSRDSSNGCKFPLCPNECPDDVKLCDDGITEVVRLPKNDCRFDICPQVDVIESGPLFCSTALWECPDGTLVTRDVNNNCEYRPCPTPQLCEDDEVFYCNDAATVWVERDPYRCCVYPLCPEPGYVERMRFVVQTQACATLSSVQQRSSKPGN